MKISIAFLMRRGASDIYTVDYMLSLLLYIRMHIYIHYYISGIPKNKSIDDKRNFFPVDHESIAGCELFGFLSNR